MPKQERIFGISGNSKGLPCPFRSILCQEGYCRECQIYLDWQRKNSSSLIGKGLTKVAQYGT